MEMKSLCLSLLSTHESAYCIFIGGLDEIGDSDGADSLLKALKEIQDALGERVEICVSSRLEHRFLRSIGRSLELQLHPHREGHASIRLGLSREYSPRSDPRQAKIVSTIEDILLAKAEGYLYGSLSHYEMSSRV